MLVYNVSYLLQMLGSNKLIMVEICADSFMLANEQLTEIQGQKNEINKQEVATALKIWLPEGAL